MPWDRPQHGELRARDVEAEEVHLVGDVGGQEEAVQGIALHPLPGPQLLGDTVSDLKSGLMLSRMRGLVLLPFQDFCCLHPEDPC